MTRQPAQKLDASDLKIHTRMVERYRRAQELAGEAERLQGEASRLAAGFYVWAEDLHERYKLDAAKGEGVREDGSLVRAG